MKCRKVAFIALSLALLAACVGVWKWSERPPYAFMDGAVPFFANDRLDKRVSLYYLSNADLQSVLAPAQRELPGGWIETTSLRGFPGMGERWASACDGTTIRLEEIGSFRRRILSSYRYPPVPAKARVLITVIRNPVGPDRFRAWLYGLRWKGEAE